MVSITLPDNSIRHFEGYTTGVEIAGAISKSLLKRAVAMRVNGELTDLFEGLTSDARVEIVTREDPEALDIIRHDAAHL